MAGRRAVIQLDTSERAWSKTKGEQMTDVIETIVEAATRSAAGSTEQFGAAPRQPTTPFDLIQMALQQDVDVAKLESLMEMQKSWLADEAFRAYAAAMNLCQREMPVVVRDKENKHTKTMYAQLETIAAAIRPIYTKHGFSLEFSEAECPMEGHRRIVCNIQHEAGHQKQFHLDSMLDDAGTKGATTKTPIQALGSTVSYLRRYLTLMIFNIAVADEDKDGNAHEPLLSETEITILRTKCHDHVRLGIEKSAEILETALVKWLSAEQKSDAATFEAVEARMFASAISALDKRQRDFEMKAKQQAVTQ